MPLLSDEEGTVWSELKDELGLVIEDILGDLVMAEGAFIKMGRIKVTKDRWRFLKFGKAAWPSMARLSAG